MAEFEVFRIIPQVGEQCYEYAESTRTQGRWPNERRFTNVPPLYVGRLVRFETGGYGDNGWRRDYFQDNTGKTHVVNYSYEGNTCFRQVPCLPAVIPSFETITRRIVKANYNYLDLPENDPRRMIIENADGVRRRKSVKSKRNKRNKRSRRNKTR